MNSDGKANGFPPAKSDAVRKLVMNSQASGYTCTITIKMTVTVSSVFWTLIRGEALRRGGASRSGGNGFGDSRVSVAAVMSRPFDGAAAG
ncbi:hypothetical protein MSA03_15430 [Microbacterium saccharophilum]|nr:hypothetical protein MSA03_15430 [Microbacterium saccharophilum]